MQVDLNDKVVRAVVQEYTNAIVNYQSQIELDFDVHKLIHTFQVVKTAEELIKLTRPVLSEKVKKQIINAAILHDIGRCHEFINGEKRKKFDHGQYGYALIKKYFPSLSVEGECTKLHNKQPSPNDPSELFPILDYVRDADMLGNIWYNALNMPIFIRHIVGAWYPKLDRFLLDEEIRNAAKEKRPCVYSRIKHFDNLGILVAQLLWLYNLKTKAAFRFAKKTDIFSKCRDAIITQALPMIKVSAAQRKKVARDIETLFPDSLFKEEFKRHGI